MSPDRKGELPLQEAIRRWSDLALVAAWDAAVAAFNRTGNKFSRASLYAGVPAEISKLAHARVDAIRAVHDDFRKRVRSGRIGLDGLQVEPLRPEVKSRLPAIEADEFRFATSSDTVTFSVFRYVQVTAILLTAEAETGVRHGSMRQAAAVEVTATGDRAHGYEPQG